MELFQWSKIANTAIYQIIFLINTDKNVKQLLIIRSVIKTVDYSAFINFMIRERIFFSNLLL